MEGAELVEAGEPKRELLDALALGLDMARVMFELPGPWISGSALADTLHRTMTILASHMLGSESVSPIDAGAALGSDLPSADGIL